MVKKTVRIQTSEFWPDALTTQATGALALKERIYDIQYMGIFLILQNCLSTLMESKNILQQFHRYCSIFRLDSCAWCVSLHD